MKEVKAAYDFLTPPAANIEDMTQPMGPLEKGDQALVEAVEKLPEGEQTVELGDGTRVRIIKEASPGRDQAIAQISRSDGSVEQTGVLIDKVPGVGSISADISEWPADGSGGRTIHEVRDNEVGSIFDPKHDRESAQAIKHEVASKIDIAREHLGEVSTSAAIKNS